MDPGAQNGGDPFDQAVGETPPLPTGSLPLGDPLPADEHACSVSLPTWSSVVGYEEGGALTEPVRRRPYSVILLDEVEKALGHDDASASAPSVSCITFFEY